MGAIEVLIDQPVSKRPDSQPIVVVPNADHFFTGKLPTLRALVLNHLAVV